MATFPTGNVPQILGGCNFGSYDSTRLYCNPGTLSDLYGNRIISTTYNLSLMCDVTTVGVNTNWSAPIGWSSTLGGMDRPLSGDNAGLYFYLMYNPQTKDLALMGSEDGTYRLGPGVPSGWEIVRQMRFSCKYKLGHGPNWNGIPDFFQAIDHSEVLLPGAGQDSNYCVLPPTQSGPDPQILSLADWVVNDVRTVNLFAHVLCNGSAGSAYIYRSPIAQMPTPVGQVNTIGDNAYFDFKVKLDSGGNLRWWTVGGALLSLYIWGYEFDDPV